jgi:hypothetical protein
VFVQECHSKQLGAAADLAVPIQVGDPLPHFCVSAHSRHKRYFRILLTARNLLTGGPFETSVTMPIMLKMLIMDGFAVQMQCKIQVRHVRF